MSLNQLDLVVAALTASIALQALPAAADQTVIDSKGKVVGIEVGGPTEGWVRRQMSDGTWTSIRVGYAGFKTGTFLSAAIPLYVSTSANCAGTKYFYTNLYNSGLVFKSKPTDTQLMFRYAAPPFQNLAIQSEYHWNSSTGTGQCLAVTSTSYVGTPKTIYLSTLGLIPPFSIK